MVDQSVNELVNHALRGWADLVGIDDQGKVHNKHNPWHKYEIQRCTEELNETRTLDPSGLTTFMFLRGLVEQYLKSVTFNAYSLILEPASIESRLAPMRAVRAILENPQVVDLIRGFQDKIRDAARHYKIRAGEPTDALEDLLGDRYELALIRRDALRSIERLDIHQFTQGEKDPFPPQYNPSIYEFWNMNSLLAAMRSQKVPGISICLIRDPESAFHSYFVFAIRNGGTLTILTDKDTTPHPAYNRMSRRPDRELVRRAERNWFPYHLLDLQEAKDGKGLLATARNQLVPINTEAVALRDIRDLTAEEFTWTILMFELIRVKFWEQDTRTPELSYTGQMVVEPAALVGSTSSLVKDGLYKPLELPHLTREDVTAESTEEQWVRKPTGFNRWMVERYGHKVPEEVFNPVGAQAKLLLDAKANDGTLVPVGAKQDRWGLLEEKSMSFETLNPVTFGTKEDIAKDRVWVARVNQMKVIQRLAEEEYEKEKDTIIAWYRDALAKNMEFLLDACARGELILPYAYQPSLGSETVGGISEWERAKREQKTYNALTQKSGRDWYSAFKYGSYSYTHTRINFGEIDKHSLATNCYERTEVRASVFSMIRPQNPQAIAILCGVAVGDLPWALQHWYKDEPYSGNSILQRLDPEDWVLANPWMPCYNSSGFPTTVGIAHSKQALHARRKKLGLPRKDYTESQKDE